MERIKDSIKEFEKNLTFSPEFGIMVVKDEGRLR